MLELMTAMAVLLIFMLALMRFFTDSQSLMDRAGDKTEQYERARIAMDMIITDLQSLFYSDGVSHMTMEVKMQGGTIRTQAMNSQPSLSADLNASTVTGEIKFYTYKKVGDSTNLYCVAYKYDSDRKVLQYAEKPCKTADLLLLNPFEGLSFNAGDYGDLIEGVEYFNVTPVGDAGSNDILPDMVYLTMCLIDKESMETYANFAKREEKSQYEVALPANLEAECKKRYRTFQRVVYTER